ncbi:MAG: C26 family cysteine hydrolase domain-containing family [Desulfovibrio sp.]|nr:C26 family cysteine hydrolase domain-containing family [Desulfovibrio sp.]
MLGITMRVMRHAYPGTVEERDALARDWPRFLGKVFPGEPLLYLPNIGTEITGFATAPGIGGLIFSGGEDWGLVPARDATEAVLFAWAQGQALPVFGVCRGAQVINRLMGGSIENCTGHVATRHPVDLNVPVAGSPCHEVNSFHAGAIPADGLAPGLTAFAVAPDGTVEGFIGAGGRIIGVMWHPERETAPAPLDMALLRAWLAGKAGTLLQAGGNDHE